MLEYPIAETFISPQGEGTFSGYRMAFIRLAGCNVGKPYTRAASETLQLQPYQEKCTDWAGNCFSCDTNYRKRDMTSVGELVYFTAGIERVCITGGEPLIHDLSNLMDALFTAGHKIHIETSGTKGIQWVYDRKKPVDYPRRPWLTVSPKYGYLPWMLDMADEIKILVGQAFEVERFYETFRMYLEEGKVLISPINDEHKLRDDNMQLCLRIQERFPKARISIQLHKILGVQ